MHAGPGSSDDAIVLIDLSSDEEITEGTTEQHEDMDDGVPDLDDYLAAMGIDSDETESQELPSSEAGTEYGAEVFEEPENENGSHGIADGLKQEGADMIAKPRSEEELKLADKLGQSLGWLPKLPKTKLNDIKTAGKKKLWKKTKNKKTPGGKKALMCTSCHWEPLERYAYIYICMYVCVYVNMCA